MNRDELYNAFILFQQLISKYDNENENNIEYIKNKLFEYVSVKKNKFFSETIECNDNYDENDNENNFDVQNYIPVYCKTENDLNINNTKEIINKNKLIKSYSFSFSINAKYRIYNTYLYTFLNNQKETIKGNSLIFNE